MASARSRMSRLRQLAAACLLLAGGSASAQSLTPMRGEVTSFSDVFAVRVFPSNPYPQRIRMEVRVYDQEFRPVEAQVSPAAFMLGSEASRPVTVVVPFDGAERRKVRICVESVPFPNQQTQIRAQICGRFLGQRL